MKYLVIPINCGDKTCYREPGVSCGHIGTKSFGTKFLCSLFGENLFEDNNGWLQRCKTCLAYEEDYDSNG